MSTQKDNDLNSLEDLYADIMGGGEDLDFPSDEDDFDIPTDSRLHAAPSNLNYKSSLSTSKDEFASPDATPTSGLRRSTAWKGGIDSVVRSEPKIASEDEFVVVKPRPRLPSDEYIMVDQESTGSSLSSQNTGSIGESIFITAEESLTDLNAVHLSSKPSSRQPCKTTVNEADSKDLPGELSSALSGSISSLKLSARNSAEPTSSEQSAQSTESSTIEVITKEDVIAMASAAGLKDALEKIEVTVKTTPEVDTESASKPLESAPDQSELKQDNPLAQEPVFEDHVEDTVGSVKKSSSSKIEQADKPAAKPSNKPEGGAETKAEALVEPITTAGGDKLSRVKSVADEPKVETIEPEAVDESKAVDEPEIISNPLTSQDPKANLKQVALQVKPIADPEPKLASKAEINQGNAGPESVDVTHLPESSELKVEPENVEVKETVAPQDTAHEVLNSVDVVNAETHQVLEKTPLVALKPDYVTPEEKPTADQSQTCKTAEDSKITESTVSNTPAEATNDKALEQEPPTSAIEEAISSNVKESVDIGPDPVEKLFSAPVVADLSTEAKTDSVTKSKTDTVTESKELPGKQESTEEAISAVDETVPETEPSSIETAVESESSKEIEPVHADEDKESRIEVDNEVQTIKDQELLETAALEGKAGSTPQTNEAKSLEPESPAAVAEPESNVAKEEAESKPFDDQTVFLYASMAGGGRGFMSKYNKAVLILQANEIDFIPVEITLDDGAVKLWRRWGASKGKSLPAVIRDGEVKLDYNELLEAEEKEEVFDAVFDY